MLPLPGTNLLALSLVEVLFAVVILTLGLIFVAAQFPLGLATSRQIAEASLNNIDAHNAITQIELQLRTVVNSNLALEARGYAVTMHPLVKPNIRVVDLIPGNHALYLDDPEFFGNYLINEKGKDPQWPFWSEVAPYQDFTDDFLSDIGHMMSPPVDESDPMVQKIMTTQGLGFNEAVFKVSLDRNYTWAALYHGDADYFYIFTLRNPQTQVRYALQEPDTAYAGSTYNINDIVAANNNPYDDSTWPSLDRISDGSPLPDDGAEDRVFPVFWRVFLDDASRDGIDALSIRGTCCLYKDVPDGLHSDEYKEHGFPAVFTVNPYVAAILRPGSFIVDADPVYKWQDINGYWFTSNSSGDIYEVEDIYPHEDDDSRFVVHLRTSLRDDLHCFWVIPQPIIRYASGGYEFGDRQPVINVTKIHLNL